MSRAFWKKRRVLVTGGAGFIGYAIARRLLQSGADVSILDIRPLPPYATREEKRDLGFTRGDVRSRKTVEKLLKQKKIQTIFHLAAEAIVGRSLENPEEALDTNVKGTWVILELIRTRFPKIEIVVASSDKAYGTHATLPYREDAPLAGENPYDVSKSAADLISIMYGKTYGLSLAIARCGNVYGPGDMHWSRLIPDALRSIAKNKTLNLRSNGKYARDYVYIDDIVEAYLKLAEKIGTKKMRGEAFNFGTNSPMSVMDVLRVVEWAAGKKVKFIVADTARYEIERQYLDSRKAKRVLQWTQKTLRKSGFSRTAAWYAGFLT